MTARDKTRLGWVLAVVFALAVLSFGYVGLFSRMMADDYCTARDGLLYGALGNALHNFNTWSGALVNFALKGALAPAQPAFHSVQTLLLIGLLAAGVWALGAQVARWLGVRLPRLWWGVLLFFSVFLLLYSVPQPRVLYWFSVITAYAYPVPFLFVQAVWWLWAMRTPSRPRSVAAACVYSAVISWAIATSAETIATALVPVYVLGGAWTWWRLPARRRVVLLLVGASMVGLVLGLAIVLASPGNAVRQAMTEQQFGHTPPDLLTLIWATVDISIQYVLLPQGLGYMLYGLLATVALLNLAPLPLDKLPLSSRPRLDTLLGLGLVALVILATTAPSVYGTGIASPHIYYFPRVAQMAYAVYLGYVAAVLLARAGFPSAYLRRRSVYRVTRLAVGGMLLFVPLWTAGYNAWLGEQAAQYAEDWDARHAYLLEQTAQGVTMGLVMPDYRFSLAEYILVAEVSSRDGENVATRCFRRYYGVTEFTITPRASDKH